MNTVLNGPCTVELDARHHESLASLAGLGRPVGMKPRASQAGNWVEAKRPGQSPPRAITRCRRMPGSGGGLSGDLPTVIRKHAQKI